MAAKRKSKKKKQSLSQRLGHALLKLAALGVVAFVVFMVFSGSVVTLSHAELPLADLPAAFDGVKIVYVSDLHITSLNSVRKVSAFFKELEKLEPDLLLLGGDYTGADIISRALSVGDGEAYDARMTEMRDLFFLNLLSFSAPLGKFAVAGDMDNALERSAGVLLADAAALGGVTLLRDQSVRIEKDGASLVLVGVDDWRTGLQDTRTPARSIYSSDCVILLSHNPEALIRLNTQPCEDAEPWIDAALTGHTMGGLFCVAGRELFSPLSYDERFNAGWHMENETKLLISRGLCGGTLPVRLNCAPQAHLITLRVKIETTNGPQIDQ